MKKTTIILAAACTLIGLGVGLTIPEADARTGYCLSGMNYHSATSNGYVCSSPVPYCQKGHEVFGPTYNSSKKRFDYKCLKSSNIPK